MMSQNSIHAGSLISPRRVAIAVVLLAIIGLVGFSSRGATADTGNISGQAEILDVNLLNQTVQSNIGQVSLPPAGGSVGGPLANISLQASGVGVQDILTINAPVTASAVSRECDGTPGTGLVEAHCTAGVEDMALSVGVNLLDGQLLNIPVVTATAINADALSTGSGGTLNSTAAGSTITGLTVGGTPVANVQPGMVIPVNISVDTSESIQLSAGQTLEDIGLDGLGSGVDGLIDIVDDLLFAQGEGVLSSLTNTLGIDTTIAIQGTVTVLGTSTSGNGTTSTGVSVTALAVDLTVSAALDVELLSQLQVDSCSNIYSTLQCVVGAIVGLLGDLVDLVGGVVGDVIGTLGFGGSGSIEEDATLNLNLGVIEMDLVSASSAIANYQAATPPSVSGINPNQGPTSGGTLVTITGTNFAGTTGVTFGDTPATSFNVISNTQITAVSPPHSAGTVPVTVTTPDGSDSQNFTYVPAPSISSINPDEGPTSGGTVVTITGTNFNGASSVTFGGTPAASFTVNSNTQITATTPAHAPGAFPVVVTTVGGSASHSFTFIPLAPSISSINPDEGPETGGTIVTITGNNFTGTSSVTFGGTPAQSFEVLNNTEIEAITPAHAPGTVPVVVTNPGGSDSHNFTFLEGEGDPSTISGIDPDEGPETGGTTVVITGTNFTGATVVRFGTTQAASFTIDSDTQITAVTPAHAPGQVNAVVTTPDGSAARSFTFTPVAAAPNPTSINPDEGPEAGGTIVTISGENFTGTTGVTFGGVPATTFSVSSDSQIIAVTPPHAPGLVDVEITSPGGTGSIGFTYLAAPDEDDPTVINVDPDNGPTEGGTEVEITGTNFVCVEGVFFGDVAATSFTVNSETSITAISPAHPAGTIYVRVVTCNGTSQAGPGATFTFTDDDGLYGLIVPNIAKNVEWEE